MADPKYEFLFKINQSNFIEISSFSPYYEKFVSEMPENHKQIFHKIQNLIEQDTKKIDAVIER